VSEALWVHTPGGVRVATDEVLALMEWLEHHHHRVRALCEQMRSLEHISWAPALRQARVVSDEEEEWARWMIRSLDLYTRQVADQERWRIALFDRPRDTAVSVLSHYLTGGRAPVSEGIGEGAVAILGSYVPAAQVDEVSATHATLVARGLAERIARIPDTDTPIRIDSFLQADGTRHVEVFIAGTAEFNRDPEGSSFDMSSNVALVAGLTSASMIATQKAMSLAGVKPGDRVVFVGHSQGGAVATRLAESGRYTTAGLITVGAPTGSLPVSGNYPAVVIEHRDDVVPKLGGARENTNAYVVTGRSDALPGDVVAAHAREGYIHTARQIDASSANQLQQLSHSMPTGLVGETRVFREREG
jgi:hypothetical protein